MKVKLFTSPETFADMEKFAALAYLTCHANADKEYVPHEKLERAIKAGHESILEHITLTYSVKGLSRACLQELGRHRLISLSVESTRHTLRKIIDDPDSVQAIFDEKIANRFYGAIRDFLDFAYENENITDNDELKYYLPECWPTNLIMTANIRELRYIIKLRTAPAALKEFRDLAHELFEAVPEEFKYLLADRVRKESE